MKHHDAARPIGKCKGCCLNMKTFCAAGLQPKAEWARKRCRQFNDRAVLEAYRSSAPPEGAKAAKLRRRSRATTAATEPHHNGLVFAPARNGGPPASGR